MATFLLLWCLLWTALAADPVPAAPAEPPAEAPEWADIEDPRRLKRLGRDALEAGNTDEASTPASRSSAPRA